MSLFGVTSLINDIPSKPVGKMAMEFALLLDKKNYGLFLEFQFIATFTLSILQNKDGTLAQQRIPELGIVLESSTNTHTPHLFCLIVIFHIFSMYPNDFT